jgi:radical SAM protein with 4Fe4S-binding SPASM domain
LHVDRPRYVQLYPTLRCDITCKVCFNRGIPDTEDITISDYERVASVLIDNGIKEIDILGGEPTLHPDIERIIDINVSRSIKTSVSTNGRNISALKRISSSFSKENVRLGVSLYDDTFSTELNDFILQHNPIIKSISTKTDFITYVARHYLGISELEYYLIYMDVLRKDDMTSSLPFYEYYSELNDLKVKYKNVSGVYCSGFIDDIDNYPELAHVRCSAGTTKITVMPDGSVYPCYLLARDSKYNIGNVLKDKFDDIWSNPMLDHFRRFSGNICENSSCDLISRCHGGCPAVSYSILGNISEPDPRCKPLI